MQRFRSVGGGQQENPRVRKHGGLVGFKQLRESRTQSDVVVVEVLLEQTVIADVHIAVEENVGR